MKMLIFGVILTLNSFAAIYGDEDPIQGLPSGTRVKLLDRLEIKKHVGYYISDRGQNFQQRYCRLALRRGVTNDNGIALLPSSHQQAFVEEVYTQWVGDALDMPPGNLLFQMKITLSGTKNVHAIICELRKTWESTDMITFADLKASLPELEFILPHGEEGTL